MAESQEGAWKAVHGGAGRGGAGAGGPCGVAKETLVSDQNNINSAAKSLHIRISQQLSLGRYYWLYFIVEKN